MTTTTIPFTPVNIEARKKLGIRAGDTVKVYQKIQEKGKTRLQLFEGLVLSVKHGDEPGAAFTVRKVASGVGMERIFPLYSPAIDKIEIVRQSKVRRSKLYYIREKVARQVRSKIKQNILTNAISSATFEKEDAEAEAAKKAEEDAKAAEVATKEAEITEEPKAESVEETKPDTEEKEEKPTEEAK